ncbi:hypothetical protein NFJ02_32g81970 [Pycnococcus provasolii]
MGRQASHSSVQALPGPPQTSAHGVAGSVLVSFSEMVKSGEVIVRSDRSGTSGTSGEVIVRSDRSGTSGTSGAVTAAHFTQFSYQA